MRIEQLTIFSSKIKEQHEFYTSTLGLKCINKSDSQASFLLGSSVLTIKYRKETTPYHFAINIPSNKDTEALEWLRSKVDILTEQETEIHDFDFWNAKAIYFYDCDLNIVELISRKNLNHNTDLPFDQHQFLSISEIGIPTTNIKTKFKQLHKLCGIPQFSGGFERFLAIGDDNGLFICVDKQIKDWFPTGDMPYSSEFELNFIEQGKPYHIQFIDDQILNLSINKM